MTRPITSSVVSRTVILWPLVIDMTVSGVISMCSIKSQLTTSTAWLSRVSRIIYSKPSGMYCPKTGAI
jgi:hypothetical protein